MVKVTNTELTKLIENKGLVVDETYFVSDYSNFPIYVTPLSNQEINPSCKTGIDGLVVYYDYITHTIYRMIDNIQKIDIPFDMYMYETITNCNNIYIGEYTGNNKFDFIIDKCNNITIDNITDGFELYDSHHINIGNGNRGNIRGCSNIEIGDNNSELNITNCTGITIGSDNSIIQLNNNSGITIGNKNKEILLSSESTGNIIGSNNRYIKLTGKNNKVNCDCLNVVSGDYSVIDDSSHIVLTNSSFNKIERCNAVNLTNSVGNEIGIGSVITIDNTNNNKIYATHLDLTNKNAFVRTNNIKNIKCVEDISINKMERSDSQGTTLNTKLNLKPSADISKNSYYIKDNVWVGVENLDESVVSLHVLPNPKSDYTSVSGAGEYLIGTQCRLQATSYGENKYFSHWILCDEDGNELDVLSEENPYIFTIQNEMYVYAIIKEK